MNSRAPISALLRCCPSNSSTSASRTEISVGSTHVHAPVLLPTIRREAHAIHCATAYSGRGLDATQRAQQCDGVIVAPSVPMAPSTIQPRSAVMREGVVCRLGGADGFGVRRRRRDGASHPAGRREAPSAAAYASAENELTARPAPPFHGSNPA